MKSSSITMSKIALSSEYKLTVRTLLNRLALLIVSKGSRADSLESGHPWMPSVPASGCNNSIGTIGSRISHDKNLHRVSELLSIVSRNTIDNERFRPSAVYLQLAFVETFCRLTCLSLQISLPRSLDSLLRYSIPIRANYQLCLKYRGFVWAVLPDAGRGAMLGEFLSLIPSLGSVSYVKQFRIAKTALPWT